MNHIRTEEVFVLGQFAGLLTKKGNDYAFQYDAAYLASAGAQPVSLSMPLRSEPFTSEFLFPFFDGLIPEGWLLHTAERNLESDRRDRFSVLAVACRDVVGNVSVGAIPRASEAPLPSPDKVDPQPFPPVERCLRCGRPLAPDDQRVGWHNRCVRQFFGSSEMPQMPLGDAAFRETAENSLRMGASAAGVQKKLSLQLPSGRRDRKATPSGYLSGYILKPQTESFRALPEAEHLGMQMAEAAGVNTVPHALIWLGDGFGYVTRRVDRVVSSGAFMPLAMEDFCQLGDRLTEEKYDGSYEKCAAIVRRYSAQSGLDLTELYLRLAFSFLIGNSDMHRKNFSVLQMAPGSSRYCLSPAYDLLPVHLVMPADKEEMALTLQGRKNKLNRKHFLAYAEQIGLSAKVAVRLTDRLAASVPKLLGLIDASFLPPDMRETFRSLIEERARRLG